MWVWVVTCGIRAILVDFGIRLINYDGENYEGQEREIFYCGRQSRGAPKPSSKIMMVSRKMP